MTWILDRLREPSTYAGLSVLAGLVGINAEEWQAIAGAVMAVAAALAIFLPETPAT